MKNILSFEQYKDRVTESISLLTYITTPALVVGACWLMRKFMMEIGLNHDPNYEKEYGEDRLGKWLLSKATNKRVAKIMFKIKKDPEYQEMFNNRKNIFKTPNLYLDDLERFKSIMERTLDKDEIEYMNAVCDDEGGKWVERRLDSNGNLVVKDKEGKTMIYFDIDENYDSSNDYSLLEMKSDREIVKDLARRLSLDKDVIKYLNTSRAKREMGWRELLALKLHGKNLDYINYITKTMVSDYNPQITGYIPIEKGDEDFDIEHEEELRDEDYDNMSIEDKVNDLNMRLQDVEDILGIDLTDDGESVERATKELGLAEIGER